MLVSDELFRLAAEAIKLRSIELGRFVTISETVATLLTARSPGADLDRDSSRDHLSAMPSAGQIVIELELSAAACRLLGALVADLSAQLTIDVSRTDAISALLFDYLVERKVTAALRHLPVEAADPSAVVERDPLATNVVPFRPAS